MEYVHGETHWYLGVCVYFSFMIYLTALSRSTRIVKSVNMDPPATVCCKTEQQLEALIKRLASDTSIVYVKILCEWRDESIWPRLCEALCINTAVQSLIIFPDTVRWMNSEPDESHLPRMLTYNSCLTTIQMLAMRLTCGFLLHDAIMDNPFLTSFFMDNYGTNDPLDGVILSTSINHYGAPGGVVPHVHHLVQLVTMSPTLTSLNMTDCNMYNSEIQFILQAAKSSPSLQVIRAVYEGRYRNSLEITQDVYELCSASLSIEYMHLDDAVPDVLTNALVANRHIRVSQVYQRVSDCAMVQMARAYPWLIKSDYDALRIVPMDSFLCR